MATKKPKGLGLGLEALLGPPAAPAAAPGTQPSSLKLESIDAGRYQPRTRMDEGSLHELAESIRRQGVMQPVVVRPLANGRWELIAGERRVRAARLAGLEEIPVLVKEVPDDAAAAMALIENIQREDLNPLEEAQGLKRLVTEFGLTHEQAAQAVGRSRSAATNLLRLLNLAPAVQGLLMAGDLEMGHARALLPLGTAEQVMLAHEIVAKRMSVRDAERRTARLAAMGTQAAPSRPEAAATSKSRDLERLEERLADHLTAPVEIRWRGRGPRARHGELAIGFGSIDELNGLLERLGVAPE